MKQRPHMRKARREITVDEVREILAAQAAILAAWSEFLRALANVKPAISKKYMEHTKREALAALFSRSSPPKEEKWS